MADFEVGKDVVLKEREVLSKLLNLLPLKAQLGFSALKDQITQKGEHGFKKLLQSVRPYDFIKLEYTCLDISEDYIALGCNLGVVFFFDRHRKNLSRFVCEVKHAPICSTKILDSQKFVATGQFNGNLTIFNYASEKNGIAKPLLKCTVESHHIAPVTAIQWTPDGTKLFTGDSEGHVAITVINMDEGQTHTVFICNEESPVVQLSFSHTALLISTLRRSLVWPFNTKMPVQVGQQERKVFGNFGACFFPTVKALPSELQPVIYASRPGLRVWKATMDGKVLVTMFFKESVSQGEPEISTIGLPAKAASVAAQEQRQFGTVQVLDDSYLVSFQGSCLWVIDPISGRLIGCHGNLGCVIDVAVFRNEIFVLTKGEEHFIRKITFRTRAESPIIQVQELNLDEDNVENEKNIRRSSSVNQFEESAKLERLIDDVGNTMVGLISGVKSTVVRTIGQITIKDDSEEERSDGGYGTSGSYSSPKTVFRSVGNGTDSQPRVVSVSPLYNRKNVNGSQACNSYPSSSPENDLTTEGKINTSVVIEHKSHETEAPFQHLVKLDYPEIVFEGTSKGVPVSTRRKKNKKGRSRNPLLKGKDDQQEMPPHDSSSQPAKDHSSTAEGHGTDENILQSPKVDDESLVEPSSCKDNNLRAHLTPNGSPTTVTNVKSQSEVGVSEEHNSLSDQEESEDRNFLTASLSDSLASLSVSSCETSADEEKLRGKVDDTIPSMRRNDSNYLPLPSSVGLESSPVTPESCNDIESRDAISCTPPKSLCEGQAEKFCPKAPDDGAIYQSVAESSNNQGRSTLQSAGNTGITGNVTLEKQNVTSSCDGTGSSEKTSARVHSHKKVHSLSALVDFQLEQDRVNEAQNVTVLRRRVEKSFQTHSLDSFKTRSSSMDTLSGRLCYYPTSGLAFKSEFIDVKNSWDGPRNSRQTSTNSSVSSGSCCEQALNHAPDDNILNVEISRQESFLEKSSSSEMCKKIDGEAVEGNDAKRGKVIESDGDDSISGNLLITDNEEERIEVEDTPRLKAPQDPSPFPAPQISTLTSIYSQEAVSLSDVNFSEPSTPNDQLSDAEDVQSFEQEVTSSSVESIESDVMEGLEGRDTPPVNLDKDGGVEMTDMAIVNQKGEQGMEDGGIERGEDFAWDSDGDDAVEMSSSACAEQLSQRLRLLADSWAEIALPSCGQVQSLMVTDTLAWCIDNHDHIFYSPSTSLTINWKRLDGRARSISANQSGTIVWAVCRKRCAYYRTNIKEGNPQGSDWEPVEKDVLCVAVDDTGVWGIKMNGDVFLRPFVSPAHPEGRGWRTVRVASDLVQISCVNGVVWALDIYNHVQVYQVEPEGPDCDGNVVTWKELPGISASYVRLGPRGVCWIIDRDGGIWFNLEVSQDIPFGSTWYQLSWSDSFVHDTSLLSSVISFFKQDHEPKALLASDQAGVWILSKYGKIRVSRGHLLGTRWELKVPESVSTASCWTCVAAQACRPDRFYIWALQPNGKLYCFSTNGPVFVVAPPPHAVLKYISASSNALWALTSGSDVYVRRGIANYCPQGMKWTKVDMTSQGQEKLCHICAGNLVVWAVDYQGNVWFQMGKEEQRLSKVAPAWVQVEGCPVDGCQFTKVCVGADDLRVWGVDDRNNVYVRRDVTENFLIGLSWEVVPGAGAKDLAVSENLIWALCPNGDVICRYGVSLKNCIGDYWKKVPGSFDHLSVGVDDELWGIDRQGHLYQRQTIHFFGAQSTKKSPSYSHLFETDDDWELI